jgi:hypothetical protein
MFSQRFWIDAAERAAATFAQTLLALIGTNAVEVVTVSLRDSAIAAVVAAGLSVAKSLAALRAPGADGSASLLNDKG